MAVEQAKFAVSLDDGSLAVLSFVTSGRGSLPLGASWLDESNGLWQREPTDPNVFAEISKAFAIGPQPVSYRRVQEHEIPVDRTYRNAWIGGSVDTPIVHDMVKAREIHLSMVRFARDKRLAELDGEWMRATGQDNRAQAALVEAERQRLRDLPATIGVEACSTIAELKALGTGV